MVFIKVLLILLSLATISLCRDLCEPATAEEVNTLLNICLNSRTKTESDFFHSKRRIATLNDSGYISFPKSDDCSELLSSLDGLLHVIPESDSELFKTLKKHGHCYAALARETPGFLCYSEGQTGKAIHTFKAFECCDFPKKNTTKLIYFIQSPVSYEITEVMQDSEFPSDKNAYKYSDLGQFSLCNDEESEKDFNIFVNETIFTRLTFKNFTFYPRLFTKFKDIYPDAQLNLETKLFLRNDNDNNISLIIDPNADSIHFKTVIQHKITSAFRIPPNHCGTGTVKGLRKQLKIPLKASIRINFAHVNNSRVHKDIEKQLLKHEVRFTEFTWENVKITGYRDDFIFISRELIYILEICLAVILLLTVLVIIAMKVMKSHKKLNRQSFVSRESQFQDQFQSRLNSFADLAEQQAEILGEKLRNGVTRASAWIYMKLM
ncbi:uncharacterized protein LOC132265912 [Phlebotomus argentipes]|uniref:uncharacterized protein LOC132265912 n=1 Tax=Phlebotomus argentipes TaxID=94469 RepID=UPI00289374D3|nr:uncharacterized protein LOC132265912 [Phlebotomus argentipes]